MFSFHKPRVYRSAEGCCICRAKSSSSRFTDSRKYEQDSVKCFDLKFPRHGEICNACVLLVKRYKRLPVGSKRHWGHVVDARAGPGTKSLTKQKNKVKDEISHSNDTKQRSSGQGGGESNSCNNENKNSANKNSSNTTTKSSLPEKFSKIFKKAKKHKTPTIAIAEKFRSQSTTNSTTTRKSDYTNRRSQHVVGNSIHSMTTALEQMDSDYEEHRSATSPSNVVEFQTQTRASSYRARSNTNNANNSCGSKVTSSRKSVFLKMGSKRRKLAKPCKNRRSRDEDNSVQFFDELEWQERKSCCGLVYECASLGDAFLFDLAHYKPCEAHVRRREVEPPKANEHNSNTKLIFSQQKSTPIIATMPAVVQLVTPQPQPPVQPQPAKVKPVMMINTNPTPALKKHHLFYKRQSESFPQCDIIATNSNNNETTTTSTTATNIIKTESNITLATTIENGLNNNNNLQAAVTSATCRTPINSTNLITNNTPYATNANILNSPTHLPRHSVAKITTLQPQQVTTTSATISNKSHNFLHKIKADTGKIVKHSMDKINTAVRIKPNEMQEMKHLIKSVDKSYILAKPTIISPNNCSNGNNIYQQSVGIYNAQAQINTTNLAMPGPSASPTSSTSSSSSSSSSGATKFSDNSSDSGFDENMQDRKSASPLQEDTEKKILTRSNVQTLFLASGVQIQAQTQNMQLAANEAAAKFYHNRRLSQSVAHLQQQQPQQQKRSNNVPCNISQPQTLKIAQVVNNGNGGIIPPTTPGAVVTTTTTTSNHAKTLRAIYNSNTIQHENGVTTIVPASSLAACSQTAAMNAAMAPSSVTITPAPPPHQQHHIGNIGNVSLLPPIAMHGKKLAAAAAVAAAAAAAANSNSCNLSNMNNTSAAHLNTINQSLNQKLILVKTASKYNNSSSNNNSNMNANSNNIIGGVGGGGLQATNVPATITALNNQH